MYMALDNIAGSGWIRYTPSTLSRVVAWSRHGHSQSTTYEGTPTFQHIRKKLHSQEVDTNWPDKCQKTYRRKLTFLQKKHPGEYVAISGNEIVDYSSRSTVLFKKNRDGVLPKIEVYYIPNTGESEERIWAEHWAILCDKTYNEVLPQLKEEHPGEFVAINGNKIDKIMKNSNDMTHYYNSPQAPFVRIYNIPHQGSSKKKLTFIV
jgi:hypothetical protein